MTNLCSHFAACGERIRLNVGEETTITSPNYPEEYGNYYECDWLFTIVPGRRIGVSFQNFDLETNQVRSYRRTRLAWFLAHSGSSHVPFSRSRSVDL